MGLRIARRCSGRADSWHARLPARRPARKSRDFSHDQLHGTNGLGAVVAYYCLPAGLPAGLPAKSTGHARMVLVATDSLDGILFGIQLRLPL